MVELTSGGRAMIQALIDGPVAWRSPVELARATGLGVEETTDHLADLDAGGWLAAWERPDDLVVTLSVAAASRLEVRIVETGHEPTPRWARRSEPDPQPPPSRGLFRGERAAGLELVVDPRPSPGQLAEQAERIDARPVPVGGRPAPVDTLPRPTVLVGSGLSPWPGPRAPLGPCPACRSGRLGPSMYCLRCDRWGLDHLIAPAPPGRPASRLRARDCSGEADRLRLDRRTKRRARRSEQAEAERRARRRTRRPALP